MQHFDFGIIILLWQIYLGKHVPNFVRIGLVLYRYDKKHFGVFFGS